MKANKRHVTHFPWVQTILKLQGAERYAGSVITSSALMSAFLTGFWLLTY